MTPEQAIAFIGEEKKLTVIINEQTMMLHCSVLAERVMKRSVLVSLIREGDNHEEGRPCIQESGETIEQATVRAKLKLAERDKLEKEQAQ